MEYPHLTHHLPQEELIEYFTLTPEERYLLPQWRKDVNILGFAVVLKTFVFLGYPIRRKEEVPASIVSFLGHQLEIEPGAFTSYRWKDSIWRTHLVCIREFTGFRPFTGGDFQELIQWLVNEAIKHPSRSMMFSAAVLKCRQSRLELPMEKELYRLVSSAWWQFFNGVCREIAARLGPESQHKMDDCLNTTPPEADRYEWLKATPDKFGMKSILDQRAHLNRNLRF